MPVGYRPWLSESVNFSTVRIALLFKSGDRLFKDCSIIVGLAGSKFCVQDFCALGS